MDNIFIENANVIKNVKIKKTVLEKINNGYLEVLKVNEQLEQEASKIQKEIEDIKNNITALENEKLDLQTLIAKGNAGLSQKLLEGTQNIVKLKKELEFKDANLKEFNNLLDTNLKTLVEQSFNEFIKSGMLVQEFNGNIENMCLKIYSHLYQCFEVVQQMQKLEHEYYKDCVEIYNYNGIKKDFNGTFNTSIAIGSVKQNFPQLGLHHNNYNPKYLYEYVDALQQAPKNKSLELYK